jgi:two-component system, cell cycle response regulator CpdR
MEDGFRLRALVVDDEPHVRDLWCEFLKLSGCDSDQVGTGMEALRCFDAGRYDLLVTDLLMPGLNGWDVAWTVRRRDPAIAVILISGSPTHIDVDLLREPGVTLLEKPVHLKTFRAAVEDALAMRARVLDRAALSTVAPASAAG